MTFRRTRLYIHAQVVWMLASLLVLAVIGSLSLEAVYFLSYIGLLIITGVTAPLAVQPRWRRRLRWVIAGATLGFAYLFVRELLDIMPGAI